MPRKARPLQVSAVQPPFGSGFSSAAGAPAFFAAWSEVGFAAGAAAFAFAASFSAATASPPTRVRIMADGSSLFIFFISRKAFDAGGPFYDGAGRRLNCPVMARPPLTARLAGFGTSVFAEMTALAARHGAVNLGQGYPDFDGPEFVKERPSRPSRAGHNQYAPMPGLPALQRGGGRAPAPLLRPRRTTPRPRSRSTRAPPRPLFATLCSRCSTRATRRSSSSPSTTPTGPASPWPGPRARVVPLGRRPSRFDAARSRRRWREARASSCSTRPSTRRARSSRARSSRRSPPSAGATTSSPSRTRSTSTSCSTGAHVPLATPARHARAHGDHLVRRQDLQPHRLEDRLDLRAARRSPRRCARPTSSSTFAVSTPFQHAPAVALARPRRVLTSACAREYRARRDRLCGGLARGGLRGRARPRGPTSRWPTSAPWASTTTWPSAAPCRSACGVAAIPVSAF